MDDDEIEKKEKDIEVVTGTGNDLNISPVYNHVKMDKNEYNKTKEKDKKIVIPKRNSNK